MIIRHEKQKVENVPFDGIFKQPRRIPEANIQAECYRLLTNKGIKCYLEYMIKGDRSKGTRGARFDMIILNKNKIVAIVEFKSRNYENINVVRSSKQLTRYATYGIPIVTCMHMTQIAKTIDEIEEILGNPRKGFID